MLKSEKKVNNHLIFRSVISPILAASFGIFILGYISATVKKTNQIEQNESRLNSILLLVAGVAEAPEAINDLVNSLGGLFKSGNTPHTPPTRQRPHQRQK